jgi:predicted CXXCH cytochrome family protein
MRRRLLAFLLITAAGALAQVNTDVLGSHNLALGGKARIQGAMQAACLYCHMPHSGPNKTALWGQTLSSSPYSTYVSDTAQNTTVQPELGADSSLCLSCHDGTVGVGQVTPYGPYTMQGKWDPMGTQLQGSHPFSLQLPLKDASNLVPSLASSGQTADKTGSVKLIKGNLECTSCHDPHNQYVDIQSQNFLVLANAKGAICLACHTSDPRTVNGRDNALATWGASAHAQSGNLVNPSAGLGGYATVKDFACQSCHTQHNASGGQDLLRGKGENSCLPCHNGGLNLSPPAPNVFAEFGKPVQHPFTTSSGSHDPKEDVLLNQNRHATCADCHNAHSAQPVQSFPLPPGIRVSQAGIAGISAADGVTVVKPAVNQYENCLRCHGTSTGKTSNQALYGYLPVWVVSAPDPLNIIPQFSMTATSSHPVFHDRSSPFAQPSLRAAMMALDGVTPGRAMGVRILCTDCHNSDDNREFGVQGINGANGPHGSKYWHILERRYEYNQATVPGGTVTNLFPSPDLSINGPYAMCGKCHDLQQVINNTTFTEHNRHISKDGFSCSTCHTSHGMGAALGSISGERMVNFDANIVASNGVSPISYNRAKDSCTLTCHNHPHGG